MIEIFDIIKGRNCINNINVNDLIALFNNNDNSVYDIAMVGKGKVVLKNKEDNKFEKLDCIHNYFDVTTTDCIELKQQIGCSESCTCKECFKCALQKLERDELSLK